MKLDPSKKKKKKTGTKNYADVTAHSPDRLSLGIRSCHDKADQCPTA